MAEIEFRSERTQPEDNPDNHREVYWLHGTQEANKWRKLGRRARTALVMRSDKFWPKTTFIDAGSIAELHDPDLRYALRFSDAAAAMGRDEEGSSDYVQVTAIDAGIDSRLLSAVYTGTGEGESDTFMQMLHSAEPSKH